MKYGLVGRNISYSFSRQYFKTKFEDLNLNNTYQNLDIESLSELDNVLKINEISGFNVTIPYKEAIIPYLDELDPISKAIGAVNCVDIKDGRKVGFNTDIFGFEGSLKPLLNPWDKRALIFGDGGAAKAVKYVLNTLNIEYKIVSRRGKYNYENLSVQAMQWANIIINTTPIGTYPMVDEVLPLPFDGINKSHLVYDLIYRPEKTKLLQIAENKGARIKNGYEMLVLQAEKSYEIWNS